MSQNQLRWRGLAICFAISQIATSHYHNLIVLFYRKVAWSQYRKIVGSHDNRSQDRGSQDRKIADLLIVIIIMCNSCDFCDVRYAISHIGDFKVF